VLKWEKTLNGGERVADAEESRLTDRGEEIDEGVHGAAFGVTWADALRSVMDVGIVATG
jgi:hypothetical protein